MNCSIIICIIIIILAIWLIMSVCKSGKKEGYKKLDDTYLLDTEEEMYLNRKRSCCGMRML